MIGRHIAHYEILSKVGEGGMGEVYRARDARLERDVAIKVLPAEFAKDPERLARFRREARLLASLNHTHIASLHGLEEVGDEVFLVMELVEGEDLSERLRRGPIDLDEALELARQFAEGLEAAHDQNVVHRDLKPANLKLTPDGKLKILDFGLARAYLGDPNEAESLEHSPTITAALTGQGVILGTAAYMSPEQARGRPIDHRTDIWAFGVILFEMLSGKRVFSGETISDTMAAVLRADPPWDALPEDTPRGVVRLLERCLERDGRRRLRDIGEARVRLERWREDPQSMQESYVTGVSGPIDLPRSRTWVPWALTGLAVVIAAFLGWRLAAQESPPPRVFDLALDLTDVTRLIEAGNGIGMSPDGRWITWVTGEGIWIRDVASQDVRLLEGTNGAFSVTFAPDSQWIAHSGGGGLHRVSVSGGTPIRICDLPTPRGIAWVDDTTIVFSPSISGGLHIVDIGTGMVETLTETDAARNERSHRWPTRVPGTRKILFECQFLGRDYDESDIVLLDLGDRSRTVVHRGGAAPRATGKGQLLFVRSNTLFAVPFDVAKGKTEGLPVPVREGVLSSSGNQEDDDGSSQFVVDETGSLLFVEDGGGRSPITRLSSLDFATGKVTALGAPGEANGLVLSPDATKVAISKVRDGNQNLFVHDLITGDESMLTFRDSVEYLGAWTPDSKTFYWSQSSAAGDKFEIWRGPIDGSTPPEFVVEAPSLAGVWPDDISPNGRYLLVNAWMGANQRDLLYLDLENPEAGFATLAGTSANEALGTFFTDEFVMYRQGLTGVGDLGDAIAIRRIPDTGAKWTFPELPGGYYGADPEFGYNSVLAAGFEGLYRFPVQITGGAVRVGQPSIVRTWTSDDRRRIRASTSHPDGTRSIVLYADSADGDLPRAKVVLVTGWVRELEERLKRGR